MSKLVIILFFGPRPASNLADGLSLTILFALGLSACANLPAASSTRVVDRQVEITQIDRGASVVVFENGLGASMDMWNRVFPEVAKRTTVFAYNRPSYGDSDAVVTPRDGAHIVDELRALLRARGLTPPYVLVGHSLGGLYMQLFARKYPNEVAGLVLVDSTHPKQFEGAAAVENQSWWVRSVFSLFLSAGQRQAEFDSLSITGEQVLALPTLTGKPVIVLSAIDKRDNPFVKLANEKRADFARLYPECKQIWVDSGHMIPRERPEAVITAINDVIEQVHRNGNALH